MNFGETRKYGTPEAAEPAPVSPRTRRRLLEQLTNADPQKLNTFIDEVSTTTRRIFILVQEFTRAQKSGKLEADGKTEYEKDLHDLHETLKKEERALKDYVNAPLSREDAERLAYYQEQIDKATAWITGLRIQTKETTVTYPIPDRTNLPPAGSIYGSYRQGPSREYPEPVQKQPGFFSRLGTKITTAWTGFWKRGKK